MKKINLGLFGASGKMGSAIQSYLEKNNLNSEIRPFLAVSSKTCNLFDFSVLNLQNVESDILNQVDVWIDFSNIENLKNYEFIQNKPIISGVTGLSENEFSQLQKYSKKQPIFWASNYSVGLWVIRQAIKCFSALKNYDFSITEIHHILKKDNPSGTALTLHKDLEKITGHKIKNPTGKRLGGVFGIHEILAANESEIIKIEHTALNREVFAEGAIKAAMWILKQKTGFYSMDDMMESQVNKN